MDTTNLANIYNKQGSTASGVNSSSAPTGGGDYTSMPSWMTGGYRNWYTGSPDYTNEPMDQYAANQGWWRSPNVAGGLLYNNLYGYQDADAVRNMYTSYGQPMSNEQFVSGKYFTPQTGQDWKQYYPDRNTDAGWQAAGYHWDGKNWVKGPSTGTGSFGAWGTGGSSGATPTSTTPDLGYGTNQTAFANYPQEWNQASNVLSQMAATGNRTADPSQWYDATDVANQMAYNGMPTDTSAAYQAQKQQTQYDIADAIKQANEQSGMTGTRWSSVNDRNAQDIGARAMTSLGATWSQQAMNAEEAARARQQTAVGQLQSLGASSAGLTEAATGRQQSASNDLSSLGNYFAQYPLQVAQQGYNMGQGMQSTDQAALDKQYSEAQRLMSENNPFFKYLYNMVNTSGTPTQYQSGCMG